MKHFLFFEGMWTSYLNLARKHGLAPIDRDAFMVRMKIWEW